VCIALIASATPLPAEDAPPAAAALPTARQVVDRIRKNVGCAWSERTVDTIKAGDPDTPVTGIATTCFATMDVLRRAAASGKNLVIVLLGHASSEEEGMRLCAAWLKGFVPEVPVEFLPAGEPFWSPR